MGNLRLVAWATVAAAISAIVALLSYCTAQTALTLQRQNAVQQVLLAYLTAYEQLAAHDADALSNISEYTNMRSGDRSRVQIVAGLLTEVVDAMYYADDPRADIWACFITGLAGPVMDKSFSLEMYTTNDKTKAAILNARDEISQHKIPDCAHLYPPGF
jgi:hypothetical protein